MAWPLTPLTTYVPTTTPAIKGADLNAFQATINGIYAGTLSVKSLTVDGTGDQDVSLIALPGMISCEALSMGGLFNFLGGAIFTPGPSGAAQSFVGANSAGGPITINLPDLSVLTGAGPVFFLIIKDTAGHGATNNITITPSGTQKIDGVNASKVINSNYGQFNLVGLTTAAVASIGWYIV